VARAWSPILPPNGPVPRQEHTGPPLRENGDVAVSFGPRLAPEIIEQFVLGQLDRAGLGHNTFTAEALALVVRSSEGLLRRTRNLSLSSLIEAVRDQIRVVDLKQVNRVLIQPHWRKDCDQPIA
jgi:hypothetical protein